MLVALIPTSFQKDSQAQSEDTNGDPLSNVNTATQNALDNIDRQFAEQNADKHRQLTSNLEKARDRAQDGILGNLKP